MNRREAAIGLVFVAAALAIDASYTQATGATTPSSGAQPGATTPSICPTPKPGENEGYYPRTYPQPGRFNENRNGAIVTVRNLYGTKCVKTVDKLKVTGVCRAPTDCKGMTYQGPDGKEHPFDEKKSPQPAATTGKGTSKDGTGGATPKAKTDAANSPSGGKTPASAPAKKDAGTSDLKAAFDPNSSADQTAGAGIKRNLREGMRGDDVKELQRMVGAREDGIFGPETKAKVTEWQKSHPELWKSIPQGDAGHFGPRSQAVLRAEQKAAGSTENTFAGEKSPTPQRRSASTFSAPGSAPTSPQSRGGIMQRLGEGAGRAASALRSGFQSGARTVRASFYGRGDGTAGRKTASGQQFNPNKYSIALPLPVPYGSGRRAPPPSGRYEICSQSRCVTDVPATDYGNFGYRPDGGANKYTNRGVDLSAGLFNVLAGGYNQGLLRVSIRRIR